MLILLFSYLDILFISFSVGLLLYYILRLPVRIAHFPSFIRIVLLGFVMTLTIASYVSVFFPVDAATNLVLIVIAAGITGFTLFRRGIENPMSFPRQARLILKLPFGLRHILLLCFAALFLISVYYAATLPRIPDTWFYHLQAIRWIEEYPAIPGLANLFSNIAYPSAIFTGNALFSLRPLTGQPFTGINSFLWFTLLAYACYRFMKHAGRGYSMAILTESLLLFIIFRFFFSWLSSSSQDPATAIMLCFIFFFISDFDSSFPEKPDRYLLIFLFTFLITIKLSNVIFIIPALYLAWHSEKPGFSGKLRAGIIPFLLLLPLVIRNIIQTGYLFYPFPYPDIFAFDWKVPQAQVVYEAMLIRSWAVGGTFPSMHDSNALALHLWLPGWINSIGLFAKVLLSLAVLSTLITAILLILRKIHISWLKLIFWLSLIASFLMWLFTAPSMRFILAVLLILVIFPFGLMKERLLALNHSVSKWMIPAMLCILAFCIEPCFRSTEQRPSFAWSFIHPPAFPQPQPRLIRYNNVMLYYTDPAISLFSGDNALPCTTQLRKGLVLRADKLKKGFRIDPLLRAGEDDSFANIKKYYESQAPINP